MFTSGNDKHSIRFIYVRIMLYLVHNEGLSISNHLREQNMYKAVFAFDKLCMTADMGLEATKG